MVMMATADLVNGIIMRSATLIIFLAFIALAHARKAFANCITDAQDLVDVFVDEMSKKLADMFVKRAFQARSLHHTKLDYTTLGKVRDIVGRSGLEELRRAALQRHDVSKRQHLCWLLEPGKNAATVTILVTPPLRLYRGAQLHT